MNALMVKKYYEIKQQIKELEDEAKLLHDEIKECMLKDEINKTTAGNYQVSLQRQDRSEIKDTIVPYLKEQGYSGLVIETYDHEMFKELEKRGVFDEAELSKHRVEKIVYALYVKPC
ncbi:MAG: hypothetical protein Q8920_16710 [Bacillota bacterium]|nr:hypothetical protein [Bacillota bacterium]